MKACSSAPSHITSLPARAWTRICAGPCFPKASVPPSVRYTTAVRPRALGTPLCTSEPLNVSLTTAIVQSSRAEDQYHMHSTAHQSLIHIQIGGPHSLGGHCAEAQSPSTPWQAPQFCLIHCVLVRLVHRVFEELRCDRNVEVQHARALARVFGASSSKDLTSSSRKLSYTSTRASQPALAPSQRWAQGMYHAARVIWHLREACTPKKVSCSMRQHGTRICFRARRHYAIPVAFSPCTFSLFCVSGAFLSTCQCIRPRANCTLMKTGS